MKKLLLVILIALNFITLNNIVLAQDESVEIATPKTFTISRATISGVSKDVITITYTERGRKVYDPVIITENTEVFNGKKVMPAKNLKVRQIVRVTGWLQNEQIVATKIELNPVTIKPVKKPVVKKVVKPKVVIKKPTVKSALK